ncbi:MAG: hypothetical protein AB7O78_18370 [Thermoleophilia bacterium]
MRTRLVIPAAILVAVAYVKGRQDAQPAATAPGAATPAPTVPGPSDASILRAQAEAADAFEFGLDEPAEADLAAAEAAAALAEPPVAEPDVFAEFLLDAVEEPVDVDEPVAEEEPAVAPAPVWVPDFDAIAVPEAAPSVFTPRPPAWEPDPVALSEWFGTPAGAAPQIEVSGRFSLGGVAVQAGHMALCGVTFPSRIADEVHAGRIRLVPEALQNVSADGLVVLGDEGFAPDGDGFTLVVAAVAPGAFAVSGRYELIAAG